jgi:predicted metal-dependent peptidase
VTDPATAPAADPAADLAADPTAAAGPASDRATGHATAFGQYHLACQHLADQRPLIAGVLARLMPVFTTNAHRCSVHFERGRIALAIDIAWIVDAGLDAVVGAISHDLNHLLLGHHRIDLPGCDRETLDLACDLCANEWIYGEPPPGTPTLDQYPGFPPRESAIERYARLQAAKQPDEKDQDQDSCNCDEQEDGIPQSGEQDDTDDHNQGKDSQTGQEASDDQGSEDQEAGGDEPGDDLDAAGDQESDDAANEKSAPEGAESDGSPGQCEQGGDGDCDSPGAGDALAEIDDGDTDGAASSCSGSGADGEGPGSPGAQPASDPNTPSPEKSESTEQPGDPEAKPAATPDAAGKQRSEKNAAGAHAGWEEHPLLVEQEINEVFAAAAAQVEPSANDCDLLTVIKEHSTNCGSGSGNCFSEILGEKVPGQKQAPWKSILRKYIGELLGDRGPTFMRPPRRLPNFIGILPGSASSRRKPKIMAVIDTSGSMSDAMLLEISDELHHLSRRNEVTVVLCDEEIQAVHRYRKRLTRMPGRGGTDFNPPFEHAFLRRQRPDVVVYFTDGYGPAPEAPPKPAVIWVIHGDATPPVMWGRVIRMVGLIENPPA